MYLHLFSFSCTRARTRTRISALLETNTLLIFTIFLLAACGIDNDAKVWEVGHTRTFDAERAKRFQEENARIEAENGARAGNVHCITPYGKILTHAKLTPLFVCLCVCFFCVLKCVCLFVFIVCVLCAF